MYQRVLSSLVLSAVLLAVPATAADEPGAPGDPAPRDRWELLRDQLAEGQRAIVVDFFRGRRGGVFVDVGAAHYSDGSTTFFLERDHGWSGIAIDALEHWAAGYAEHRPRTRFFTYIVTDHSGAEEPFYRLQSETGSTALKKRADTFRGLGAEVTEVLVPTTTMSALLDSISIEKIDFLSMDIEGSEPAALAGFDIERFRPELVGIEVFPANEKEILAYFERHGYRRIDAYLERHKEDWYFTCKVEAACASEPESPAGGGPNNPSSETEGSRWPNPGPEAIEERGYARLR